MRTIVRSTALAALAGLVPLSAFAAQTSAKPTSVRLTLSSKLMHTKSIMHATGKAKLHWSKGDVTITVTTDGLPSATTLGKRAYVIFASDGTMWDRVGALKRSGMMAGGSGMVMMSKITDLWIYAENAANVKKPGNGVLVMSAMIG
jgi:hypothetical protein